MLSQDAQDAIRAIVRDENAKTGRSIEAKLDAGFNATLSIRLRRLARFLKGGAYDVAGVGGTDTKGYMDDASPLA